MWGGNYQSGECDWSGREGEFAACPDLQVYNEEEDCDPTCTLTGGTKRSKDSECRWHNINDGGAPDNKFHYI